MSGYTRILVVCFSLVILSLCAFGGYFVYSGAMLFFRDGVLSLLLSVSVQLGALISAFGFFRVRGVRRFFLLIAYMFAVFVSAAFSYVFIFSKQSVGHVGGEAELVDLALSSLAASAAVELDVVVSLVWSFVFDLSIFIFAGMFVLVRLRGSRDLVKVEEYPVAEMFLRKRFGQHLFSVMVMLAAVIFVVCCGGGGDLYNSIAALVPFGFMLLLIVNMLITYYRVREQVYADNGYEAAELLRYVVGRLDKGGGFGGGGGGLFSEKKALRDGVGCGAEVSI